MAEDYSGKDLRGHSFRGRDLRGASFRGADLRGVSFRDADLRGADLREARMGRGGWRRWATDVAAFIVGALSGILALFGTVFLALVVHEWKVAVGMTAGQEIEGADWVFSSVVISGLALGASAATRVERLWPFAAASGLVVAVAVAGAGAGDGAVAVAGAMAMVVAVGGAAAMAGPGAGAGPGAMVGAVAVAVAVAVAGALDFGWAVTGAGAAAGAGASASLALLGWYFRRRALAGDPQLAALQRWVLALGAWSGTDLRGARLGWDGPGDTAPAETLDDERRGADLRGARMPWVRLAGALDLTHADLRGALDLHLADGRGTIHADRRVRDLLVSGQGTGRDYDHADLRGAWLEGANLQGANLTDAELTDACLRGADLTDADLSRATAVGADFTGACLTGALLKAWNIEPGTRLAGAQAEYVWLQSEGGRRTERRPASGVFGPGQFAALFEEVLDTVDFVFDKGIDWRAFVVTLDRLRVEAGESGEAVEVQAIENKDGVFVVRLKVPVAMDKEAVHRAVTAEYGQQLSLAEARVLQLEGEVRATKAEADQTRRSKAAELKRQRKENANLWSVVNRLAGRTIEVNAEATAVGNGKTTHISGVSGSIINVDASLSQVTQSVGSLPGADDAARERLAGLLARLDEALKQTPQDRAEEAAAVAVLAAELIAKAKADKPNRGLLTITGKGLIEAAKALAGVVPAVATLVKEIVGLVAP